MTVARLCRTDDPAFRVEHVEHRGLVEARWTMIIRGAWALVIVVPFASWLVWTLIAWADLGAPGILLAVFGGGTPAALAVIAVLRRLSPYDTPTTPLRYHLRVLQAELNSPRPEQGRGFAQETTPVIGPAALTQPVDPEPIPDFTRSCLQCPTTASE